jgi:hypothetical protein
MEAESDETPDPVPWWYRPAWIWRLNHRGASYFKQVFWPSSPASPDFQSEPKDSPDDNQLPWELREGVD